MGASGQRDVAADAAVATHGGTADDGNITSNACAGVGVVAAHDQLACLHRGAAGVAVAVVENQSAAAGLGQPAGSGDDTRMGEIGIGLEGAAAGAKGRGPVGGEGGGVFQRAAVEAQAPACISQTRVAVRADDAAIELGAAQVGVFAAQSQCAGAKLAQGGAVRPRVRNASTEVARADGKRLISERLKTFDGARPHQCLEGFAGIE